MLRRVVVFEMVWMWAGVGRRVRPPVADEMPVGRSIGRRRRSLLLSTSPFRTTRLQKGTLRCWKGCCPRCPVIVENTATINDIAYLFESLFVTRRPLASMNN